MKHNLLLFLSVLFQLFMLFGILIGIVAFGITLILYSWHATGGIVFPLIWAAFTGWILFLYDCLVNYWLEH